MCFMYTYTFKSQSHQQFKIDCGITSNAQYKSNNLKLERENQNLIDISTHTHDLIRAVNDIHRFVLNITRWQNIHYISIIVLCISFHACECWWWALNEWTNKHELNTARFASNEFNWLKSVNKTITWIQWAQEWEYERVSIIHILCACDQYKRMNTMKSVLSINCWVHRFHKLNFEVVLIISVVTFSLCHLHRIITDSFDWKFWLRSIEYVLIFSKYTVANSIHYILIEWECVCRINSDTQK